MSEPTRVLLRAPEPTPRRAAFSFSTLPASTILLVAALLALVLAGCASSTGGPGRPAGAEEAAVAGAATFPRPDVVPHARWEATPPAGHAAVAGRRNLAPGDAFLFHDLGVELLAIEAGSARVALSRGGEREERVVAGGAAFNWSGYHVAVVAVHEPGELGGGLTALEVATVASLPPEVAASDSAGGAGLRLRVPHRITHVTLHHSGSAEPLRPEDDVAEKLRALQSWGAADRNWWDLPYHYLIGLDGTIYEGRDHRYSGETNTRYDPRGHLLISVVGNYGIQEPTAAQLDAIADLMAWAVTEFDVPLDRIGGHYDYADTSCPGTHLVRYLEDGTLRRMVEERLGLEPTEPPAASRAAAARAPAPGTDPEAVPAADREFRALWVATVGNIDWPSRPGLTPAEQREELVRLLDAAVAARFNAIILQVRTAGDALYDSPLEPWSEYLSGEQGVAPGEDYDPLAFAVRAAHARGLELHAWFNPYRARHPSAEGPLAPGHLANTRPELVREYGTHLWMDPGEPAVQDHTMAVIMDVVRRYDIDGIHIDDYFYPYRERDADGAEIPFPDEPSWTRYVEGGGTLSRDDWRRRNVDTLIERMYRETKAAKPWVKVGISPFGLWRPGYPDPVCCFDPYDQLYADSRSWLVNGWLDYFTPQLYWPIGQTAQSYALLLGWWAEQNTHDRHLWPGSFAGRVRSERRPDGWPARELLAQIYVQRGHPGASGTVHFPGNYLLRNPDGVADSVRATAFARPALVPPSPWLDDDAPARPRLALDGPGADADRAGDEAGAGEGVGVGGGVAVGARFEPGDDAAPWAWLVRVRRDGRWTTEVLPGWRRAYRIEPGAPVERMAVSAVDRLGNESPAARLDRR